MRHPKLPNLWEGPGDFYKFARLGPSAVRAEGMRRLRAADPALPEGYPLTNKRTRFEMSDQLDKHQWDAFARLRNRAWFADQRQIFNDTRADWRGCHPFIKVFAGRMLSYFNAIEVPMFVHNSFRTQQEQRELVARGVSMAPWPKSGHNRGFAIDLVHGTLAWDLSKREWAAVGKVGGIIWAKMMADVPSHKRLDLKWGGDWGYYDPAHWEVHGATLPFASHAELLSLAQYAGRVELTRKKLYDLGKDFGFSNADMFPKAPSLSQQ